MENVAGEQGLLTRTIFHTNPSNFPKKLSCHKNSLCNVRRLKPCHFHIFDMLFLFLASVLYHDRF